MSVVYNQRMEAMDGKWIRHMGTSEMAFLVRASSSGRTWHDIDATLFDTSGGTVSCPGAPTHFIAMHVGAPIKATRRYDGMTHKQLQTPGDIDLAPAGWPTTWEDSGPSTFLRIDLSPVIVRATAESMGIDPDKLELTPQLQIKDPVMQHIAWALKLEVESTEPSDRLCAESLASALTTQLLRKYARSSAPSRGLTKRQWQVVADYINDNLTLDLSLADLATVAGLGTSTFKVLFKRSVGVPVHKYVVRRRVEHAMNLLGTRSTNLNEIALRSGFVDESHMARCFRRVVGMTPAAIARQYR